MANAREKLNKAYLAGSLLLAGLVGILAESWLIFLFALIVFVGLNLYSGEIRPNRRRGR
jgi:hypothetical protein